MIIQLEHHDLIIAEQINTVLQSAYQVEATLLSNVDFPPLRRHVSNIMAANSEFYGFVEEGFLTAVAEIENKNAGHLHIASLAVAPHHFRKGYGRKLVQWVLDFLSWDKVTVTTAVANSPAVTFYKKQGFQPLSFETTPDGFELITLIMQ